MRTLVRLAVVAAVINAVVQGGLVAATFFQFRDAAQEIVLFGGAAPEEDLLWQILERAKQLEVPVQSSDVTVHREGVRTVAVAAYTQDVELFPRFKYPVPFSFTVDALSYQGNYAAPPPAKTKPR